MAITYRDEKGSQLSSAEVDANFRAVTDSYGEITFSGTGGDLNPTDIPMKITTFDTEKSSIGLSASHLNNVLVVNNPGAYQLNVSANATVSDSEIYQVYIAKNDIELASEPVDVQKNITELVIKGTSFVQNVVANDEFSIYVASSTAGGQVFSPVFLKLQMTKVGQ